MNFLRLWTFARASAAFVVQDGVLVSIPPNEPRIADEGLLVEPSRTNLLLASQALDHSSWIATNCSIVANTASAPDGTVTADKLVSTVGTSIQRVRQSVSCQVGERQTVSVFAKVIANDTRWLFFRLSEAGAPAVWFDLRDKVVGPAEAAWLNPKIEVLADDWCRVSASFVATDSLHTLLIGPCDSDVTTHLTGDGVKGLYLWGGQWEAADDVSSYILTNAAPSSRAADELTLSFVPQAFGYLYVDFSSFAPPDSVIVPVVATDVGPLLYVSDGFVQATNGTVVLQSANAVSTNEDLKVVLAWNANGRSLCVNGSFAEDLADIGEFSSLSVSGLNGYLRNLSAADGVPLSNDSCIGMTSPNYAGPSELVLDAAPATSTTRKIIVGRSGGEEVFYVGQQGSDGFAPQTGVLGVVKPTSGEVCEFGFYQYGATLKYTGQIFELFLNADTNGHADLSVRGITQHRGSRINARNGLDTISTAIGALDDRAGIFLTGNIEHMPVDMRIGHARNDGDFAFITGIGDLLDGGSEVARITAEGTIRLSQRATAPSPPEGHTEIWAMTDGTLNRTSNVGGVLTTTSL